MFFPKLRRRAKWVFVLLALAFGGGFVIFGVGSNLPSGLGDILQDVSFDNAPSVGDARERVRENPRDPEAQLALADALQQNQRPDEAIAPLEAYVKMRPRDEEALRQLASLYSAKANRISNELNVAALEYQEAATGQLVQPKLSGDAAQAFFQGGQFEQAFVNTKLERYNELLTESQQAAGAAQRTYERVVKLSPRDPQLRLLLASTAEQAGDVNSAIRAYEAFLRLAPEDSSAPAVRDALGELRKQAQSSGSSTTVTPLTGGS
jgi:cytochrome c-type biogenesis protein CcmH/NrfG